MREAGDLQRTLRTNVYIQRIIEDYADMLVRVAFTYLNISDAEDVAHLFHVVDRVMGPDSLLSPIFFS
jgi:hypothetical protein